jgi:hypothetical protein
MNFYLSQARKLPYLLLLVWGVSLSSKNALALRYGPEDSALLAACGVMPSNKLSGAPFTGGRVQSAWKWNSDNPFNDDLDLSPSRLNATPLKFPTCESIVLDALLADEKGGPRAAAARCQAQASNLERAKLNYTNSSQLGGSRSLSESYDASVICKNPSKFDAEFACAYLDHQKDFRNYEVQLQAINEVEAICASVGVNPLKNLSRSRNLSNAFGVNTHSGQYCGGNGNIYIVPPQKSAWTSFWENIPTVLGIGALTYGNYQQNQNAKLAIQYNHDLGLGNAVNPWTSAGAGASMGGLLGGGLGGGIGLGAGLNMNQGYGMMGFASCGVPPYNVGYTGCSNMGIPGWGNTGSYPNFYGSNTMFPYYGSGYGNSAYPNYNFPRYGSGYSGMPGPYGTLGGNYGYSPYGGYMGYPNGSLNRFGNYGNGFGSGYGSVPGPYGTLGGGNGWSPYSGVQGSYPSYGSGSPFMGGYGGAGAYAQSMLHGLQQATYEATQISQKEKQLNSIDQGIFKLNQQRDQIGRGIDGIMSSSSLFNSGFPGLGGFNSGGLNGGFNNGSGGSYYNGSSGACLVCYPVASPTYFPPMY